MTDAVPIRIILAAEGPSDFRRIQILLNHLLSTHTAGTHFFAVDGLDYIQIKRIPELARRRGFDRRYNKGDRDTIRKLYNILKHDKLLSNESIIVWARDDDGDNDRRSHALEERSALPSTTPLFLAIASECGEAWVIAGWTSETKEEQDKQNNWRRALGFHPHEHPQRLSHKENVPKSAKTVVHDLIGYDSERELKALLRAATANSDAARACGISAFCEDICTWISNREKTNE